MLIKNKENKRGWDRAKGMDSTVKLNLHKLFGYLLVCIPFEAANYYFVATTSYSEITEFQQLAGND